MSTVHEFEHKTIEKISSMWTVQMNSHTDHKEKVSLKKKSHFQFNMSF
jgi:hypothetical protein